MKMVVEKLSRRVCVSERVYNLLKAHAKRRGVTMRQGLEDILTYMVPGYSSVDDGKRCVLCSMPYSVDEVCGIKRHICTP